MSNVIIIGAGISGLTAAYWLKRQGVTVDVYEKDTRYGGAIGTTQKEGYLFERGPNSFMDNEPDTLELCHALKLENEMLKQSMRTSERYLYFNGKLQSVPMGPGGLIKTELLSSKAKRGLLKEPFRKSNRSREDESLADFIRRRLGSELLDNMVTPFISGVYAGDPEKLSLRATFPILYDLEREHGSIVRGGLARVLKRKKKEDADKPKKPRPKHLCSFVDGMSVLTDAIADYLGDSLHLGEGVESIEKEGRGYRVRVNGRDPIRTNAVVIAIPAYTAEKMLGKLTPQSTQYLQSIPYNKVNVVGLGYHRDSLEHNCDGFGFLVPRNQGVRILGSIWSSSLFVRRAPAEHCCFTIFSGGGLDPTAYDLTEEELLNQIQADLKTTVGASEKPIIKHVVRWEKAIPQYPIGHVEKIETFKNELASHSGLYCIGNYVGGISVNDCIRTAKQSVEKVCQNLNQ